jgi:hypothetical protein
MTYPTTIPTFTSKTDGVDYPRAVDINDLQNNLSGVMTALAINFGTSPSSGQTLQWNGTSWAATTPASGAWTAASGTPTRVSNTTFTVTGDYTTIFRKGLVIKWAESSTTRWGMVSIPSTYSAPNTTVTIIGSTMASIDASSLKYAGAGAEQFAWRFAVAGTLGATGTDVANKRYAEEPMIVIGADIQHGTAGVTTTFVADINKNGTTMFTVKPSLATTVTSSPTPFTADTATTLALGDYVTIDIDTINTGTLAIDLYITLYVFPARLEFLT